MTHLFQALYICNFSITHQEARPAYMMQLAVYDSTMLMSSRDKLLFKKKKERGLFSVSIVGFE